MSPEGDLSVMSRDYDITHSLPSPTTWKKIHLLCSDDKRTFPFCCFDKIIQSKHFVVWTIIHNLTVFEEAFDFEFRWSTTTTTNGDVTLRYLSRVWTHAKWNASKLIESDQGRAHICDVTSIKTGFGISIANNIFRWCHHSKVRNPNHKCGCRWRCVGVV